MDYEDIASIEIATIDNDLMSLYYYVTISRGGYGCGKVGRGPAQKS